MPELPTPNAELRTIIRWTGLATWVAVIAQALLALPAKPGRLTPDEVLPWTLCLLGFAGVFLLATRPWRGRAAHLTPLTLISVEVLLALLANHIFNGNSLLSGLLLVTAAQVGLLLRLGHSLLWVLAQTAGLAAVLLGNWPALDAWAYTSGMLCFQGFAVASARVAAREVQARHQLAAVVRELRATRQRLADASRNAERLHIARELHDLLGHHLTALTMNLEVAAYITQEDQTRTHVMRAQALAKLLLGDVREAVQSMRDRAALDFRSELTLLTDAVSTVQVIVEYPDGLPEPDDVRKQVLLRCVQEVLTNTVRHAGADHLWLTFTDTPGGLEFRARDNGRGAATLRLGCGLRGMRERLEAIGGHLNIETLAGRGLRLHATLPHRLEHP
ncbi:sensor histidine kinase [Deinococcus maricopensis]|uniref:Integral membrane sensor signal transduction histidine kinase n=1 Tax=Deinococcus maricopensis (strain DSM 21211 / LMG 22137 / NRRL B-23946 / LB-34) TaxID=709986 RepID=E8U753_DEIML|nr:histidine kinase [Deinococcus maricopensis]ADV66892.1 integral membrane sensor signal transduction histidine kinase [Deinococcus maricopensis DSM 21211]